MTNGFEIKVPEHLEGGVYSNAYEDDVNNISRPNPLIKGIRVVGFKARRTEFR
jgi:hypothetical protein